MEGKESGDGEGGLLVAIALSGGSKSKALIKWAMEKFVPEGKVSFKLLHVYTRITAVPTPMGNLIPLHQVRDDVATAYKKEVEWQKMEMLLPYQKLCTFRKVPADIVLVEADEIANALSHEIAKIGAKDVVIGASSNGLFSRKVKGQMLSCLISECAPHACTVYVVSKGKLESLRPSDEANANILEDTTTRDSCARYSSTPLDPGLSCVEHSVGSPYQTRKRVEAETMRDLSRWRSLDLRDTEDALSFVSGRCTVTGSLMSQASSTTTYTTESSDSFVSENPSTLSSPSALNSSQAPTKTKTKMDMELEMLRMELRHIRGMYSMAQHETVDASRKLSELSKLRLEEATHLKEMKEKEEKARESTKVEKEKTEAAKKEAEDAKECAFKQVYQRKEAELAAFHSAREKEKLKHAFSGASMRHQKFAWKDIEAGCSSFSDDLKIGIGSYGTVYKCKLHHTTVAAKVLHSKEGSQSKQFQQELEILSRIRHPHILLLLGACPEQGCLVYEYMENGSLEDRLWCRNQTSPIKWYDRFRMAWEVALALAFLHSSKPKPIIHRDLKPANILLDQNLVSKIGDAGLCTMLNASASGTLYRDTGPVGTLCYIDPEYQRTGMVSTKSDVYALGMVILQLLTARPAVGITHVVEDALEEDRLMQVMDATAGNWPVRETTEMALLALQCAELRRKDRPDLSHTVLPLLDKLKEFAHQAKDVATNAPIAPPPTHFICPILRDVMDEPCVAADGYTYDRKAIEMWLKENDTSPTTDFPLSSKELLSNYTLHYAIMEWKTKRKSSSPNSWRSI